MLNPACLSRPRDLNQLVRLVLDDLAIFVNNLRSLVEQTSKEHPDYSSLVKARDEVAVGLLGVKESEERVMVRKLHSNLMLIFCTGGGGRKSAQPGDDSFAHCRARQTLIQD